MKAIDYLEKILTKSKAPTLVHGNKVKRICIAIRPSSKIWNFDLHSNMAKLENFESKFALQ